MIPSKIGLESFFHTYKYGLKSNNDALVVLVHWYLIQNGYKCQRSNGVSSEILPIDWNDNQEVFKISYTKDGKGYELKCLVIDENMLISLARLSDKRVASLTAKIQDYVLSYTNKYEKVYKNIFDFLENFNIEVEALERSNETTENTSHATAKHSYVPSEMNLNSSQIHTQEPLTEVNPRGYGRSDLDPFSFEPIGNRGGMIFDPFRGGRFTPPLSSDIPHGSIPPGARFDPTQPPDPDAPQAHLGSTRMDPNPDHLKAPDFGDKSLGGSAGGFNFFKK